MWLLRCFSFSFVDLVSFARSFTLSIILDFLVCSCRIVRITQRYLAYMLHTNANIKGLVIYIWIGYTFENLAPLHQCLISKSQSLNFMFALSSAPTHTFTRIYSHPYSKNIWNFVLNINHSLSWIIILKLCFNILL